jgi:hypothetical protein
MAGGEAAARAKAYWGPGVYEGDPVDIRKSQRAAQERFVEVLNANPRAPVVMPLEYIVDPTIIRKAIFDPSFSADQFNQEIRKAKQDYLDQFAPDIKKGGNTSANSMVHATWDDEVTMLFKRAVHPIQAIILTEACLGKFAQWDAIGPDGGASAAYVSENPTFSGGEFTPGSRVEACKIAASDGYVTQMAQFAATNQVPARDPTAILTEACNESLRELKDRGLLGVSRDTNLGVTVYEDAPSLAFAGLYELINNNTADPNWINVAGSSINTWEKLEPYVQTVYLNMLQDKIVPDVALTDFPTFHMICRGLEKYYLSQNLKTTEFGIQTLTLNFARGPLPVVPLEQLPSATGDNGAFQMLDSTRLAYRQLWGPMFQLLANENGNAHFLINEAGVLIDKTDTDGSSTLQGAVFGITR